MQAHPAVSGGGPVRLSGNATVRYAVARFERQSPRAAKRESPPVSLAAS